MGADLDQASSSNALPDCQLDPPTNPSISVSENPSISISISEIACESKIQGQSNPGRQPRLVLTPLGKVRPSPLTACLGIDQVRGLQPFPPRDLKEKISVKSAGVPEAAPREVDPPSAKPVEAFFLEFQLQILVEVPPPLLQFYCEICQEMCKILPLSIILLNL